MKWVRKWTGPDTKEREGGRKGDRNECVCACQMGVKKAEGEL